MLINSPGRSDFQRQRTAIFHRASRNPIGEETPRARGRCSADPPRGIRSDSAPIPGPGPIPLPLDPESYLPGSRWTWLSNQTLAHLRLPIFSFHPFRSSPLYTRAAVSPRVRVRVDAACVYLATYLLCGNGVEGVDKRFFFLAAATSLARAATWPHRCIPSRGCSMQRETQIGTATDEEGDNQAKTLRPFPFFPLPPFLLNSSSLIPFNPPPDRSSVLSARANSNVTRQKSSSRERRKRKRRRELVRWRVNDWRNTARNLGAGSRGARGFRLFDAVTDKHIDQEAHNVAMYETQNHASRRLLDFPLRGTSTSRPSRLEKFADGRECGTQRVYRDVERYRDR